MNAYFLAVWTIVQPRILVLAILMLIDVLLGIIIALIKKEFKWDKLTSYLNTDVLPIIGWVAVVLITCIPADLIPSGFTIPIVADIVYGTVFIKILASVLKSLADAGVLTSFFGKIGISE